MPQRRARSPRPRLFVEVMEPRLLLATLIVNGTDDTSARDAELTLREAIEVVDGSLAIGSLSAAEQGQIQGTLHATSVDSIDFDIPGTGVHTIALTAPLPAITSPVSLDGTTEPGAKANDLATGDDAVLPIVLDGSHAGAGVDGLTIADGGSFVRGLVIANFSGSGITITSGADQIAGDFVGTDATGEKAAGDHVGIFVNGASFVTIGGATAADRDLISGNATLGVDVSGATLSGTIAEGNLIGTDAKATSALPNAGGGVEFEGGVSRSLLGGTISGLGNVIAGNGGFGVAILPGSATEPTQSDWVLGNLIYANSGAQIEDAALATSSPTITAANAYPSGIQVDGSFASPSVIRADHVEFFTYSNAIGQPPQYVGEADSTTNYINEIVGDEELFPITGETFHFVPTVPIAPGQMLVAIATSLDGARSMPGGPSSPTLENSSDFSAPFTLVSAPQADLSVTASVTTAPVHPGGQYTETFTVTNAGPDAASGASLAVVLPVNYSNTPNSLIRPPSSNDVPPTDSIVSYSPTQGVTVADGFYSSTPATAFGYSGFYVLTLPKLQVSLGTIAPGADAVFTLVLQASDEPSTGVSATEAKVSSSTYDSDSANKDATLLPSYVADYDLVATSLTASTTSPVIGGALTFTFVVTNKGPDIAGGVEVAVATTFPFLDTDIQTLQTLGAIAPGAYKMATFTIHPTALGTFSITFNATTTFASGETNASNNFATLALNVGPVVGPKALSVGPASVKARGSAISVAFNEGLATAGATSPAAFAITTAGRDRKFGTKDDKRYPIVSAQYNAAMNAVVLVTKAKLSPALTYELTVTRGVTDASGTPLDGGTEILKFGRSALVVPKAPKTHRAGR